MALKVIMETIIAEETQKQEQRAWEEQQEYQAWKEQQEQQEQQENEKLQDMMQI
jgi:hypothetical protein